LSTVKLSIYLFRFQYMVTTTNIG